MAPPTLEDLESKKGFFLDLPDLEFETKIPLDIEDLEPCLDGFPDYEDLRQIKIKKNRAYIRPRDEFSGTGYKDPTFNPDSKLNSTWLNILADTESREASGISYQKQFQTDEGVKIGTAYRSICHAGAAIYVYASHPVLTNFCLPPREGFRDPRSTILPGFSQLSAQEIGMLVKGLGDGPKNAESLFCVTPPDYRNGNKRNLGIVPPDLSNITILEPWVNGLSNGLAKNSLLATIDPIVQERRALKDQNDWWEITKKQLGPILVGSIVSILGMLLVYRRMSAATKVDDIVQNWTEVYKKEPYKAAAELSFAVEQAEKIREHPGDALTGMFGPSGSGKGRYLAGIAHILAKEGWAIATIKASDVRSAVGNLSNMHDQVWDAVMKRLAKMRNKSKAGRVLAIFVEAADFAHKPGTPESHDNHNYLRNLRDDTDPDKRSRIEGVVLVFDSSEPDKFFSGFEDGERRVESGGGIHEVKPPTLQEIVEGIDAYIEFQRLGGAGRAPETWRQRVRGHWRSLKSRMRGWGGNTKPKEDISEVLKKQYASVTFTNDAKIAIALLELRPGGGAPTSPQANLVKEMVNYYWRENPNSKTEINEEKVLQFLEKKKRGALAGISQELERRRNDPAYQRQLIDDTFYRSKPTKPYVPYVKEDNGHSSVMQGVDEPTTGTVPSLSVATHETKRSSTFMLGLALTANDPLDAIKNAMVEELFRDSDRVVAVEEQDSRAPAKRNVLTRRSPLGRGNRFTHDTSSAEAESRIAVAGAETGRLEAERRSQEFLREHPEVAERVEEARGRSRGRHGPVESSERRGK